METLSTNPTHLDITTNFLSAINSRIENAKDANELSILMNKFEQITDMIRDGYQFSDEDFLDLPTVIRKEVEILTDIQIENLKQLQLEMKNEVDAFAISQNIIIKDITDNFKTSSDIKIQTFEELLIQVTKIVNDTADTENIKIEKIKDSVNNTADTNNLNIKDITDNFKTSSNIKIQTFEELLTQVTKTVNDTADNSNLNIKDITDNFKTSSDIKIQTFQELLIQVTKTVNDTADTENINIEKIKDKVNDTADAENIKIKQITNDFKNSTDTQIDNIINIKDNVNNTANTENTNIEQITNDFKNATDTQTNDIEIMISNLQEKINTSLPILADKAIFGIGTPGQLGFGISAIYDEFLPLDYNRLHGNLDKSSPNYGSLIDDNGSVFFNIPPFYYKMIGDVISISDKALDGYILPRAFIDSPHGFLHFSHFSGNNGEELVLEQSLNPLAIVDAFNSMGYKTTSIFQWNALLLISLAHLQSNGVNTAYQFNDVSPYFPKAEDNNSLDDIDDIPISEPIQSNLPIVLIDNNTNNILTGLIYLPKIGATCLIDSTSISMLEHGLSPNDIIYFGSTPTNGETYNTSSYTVDSIIDDNNFTVTTPLQREILITDGVYSPKYFRILKETINPNQLSSQNLFDESLYDFIDLTQVIYSNISSTHSDNTNEFLLNFSTDVNSKEYKLASLGIPKNSTNTTQSPPPIDDDLISKYLTHGFMPRVGMFYDNFGLYTFALNRFTINNSYLKIGGLASVTLKKKLDE